MKDSKPTGHVSTRRWMKYIARNEVTALGAKNKQEPLDFTIYKCAQTLASKPDFYDDWYHDQVHAAQRNKMAERRKRQESRTRTDMQPLIAETNKRRKIANLPPIGWRQQMKMIMGTRR